jgi:hypothetical protein
MRKLGKKVSLNRETVRVLSSGELNLGRGGFDTHFDCSFGACSRWDNTCGPGCSVVRPHPGTRR